MFENFVHNLPNKFLKQDLECFKGKLWTWLNPSPSFSLFLAALKSFNEDIAGAKQDLGSFAADDDWQSLSFNTLLNFLSNISTTSLKFDVWAMQWLLFTSPFIFRPSIQFF